MWLIPTMPTLIFLATPLLAYREISQKANLVQEGRRNFLNTPKCAQWPHLYTTYEATYGLKCLVFEKLAKNWFLHDRVAKNHNFRYLLHKCHTIVSRFKLRTDQNGKQLWRLKHIIHIYHISFMSRSWCCKYYLIPMLVRVMVDISSIWEVRDPIFLKIGITWYANHNTKRINDDYWPQMP